MQRGRVAETDGGRPDGVVVVGRQRVPPEEIRAPFLAYYAQDAVLQLERARGIAGGLEVPRDHDGIAAFDLHLVGLRALGQRGPIQRRADELDAVCVVVGQIAIDVGERAALEAEHHRFGDLEDTGLRELPLDVETLGIVALRCPRGLGRHAQREQGRQEQDALDHDDLQ